MSIASFVEEQLQDPLHFVNDLSDLNDLDVSFAAVFTSDVKQGLQMSPRPNS